MRCKSCDCIMDVVHVIEIEGKDVIEELCSGCRSIAFEEWDYAEDHEHMFQNLSCGPTQPLKTPY